MFTEIRVLKMKNKIIMWDVMSGNFDTKQKPEKIIKRVQKLNRPGSVVVFHDTLKAGPKLKIILLKILKDGMGINEFIGI